MSTNKWIINSDGMIIKILHRQLDSTYYIIIIINSTPGEYLVSIFSDRVTSVICHGKIG